MKKSLLIIIILLLVNMVNLFLVSPVYGPVYTTNALYVSPPSIIDITKTAGTTFTVDINVKDITNLGGYNFFLNYTTTVLTATGVTLGSFFPSNSWVIRKQINDAQGYIWYVVAMPLGSQVGKSGSGILATISFTVDSIGESPLDLDTLEILDIQSRKITHNVYDGYFSNILRPWIYVDPSSVVPPLHLIPGENFTINVNVFNVTNLHRSEFKLAYNTTLLEVLNITEGSFMAGFGTTTFTSDINETLGIAEANVTLVDPTKGARTPNWPQAGNGTLVAVTFNITEIGETDLDLYDTKLSDPASTLINHYTFDGYFSDKTVIHDIAITDVTTTITTVEVKDNMTFFTPKTVSEVSVGDKLNVTVHVKNNGTMTESFNVTAYYDDNIIDTKNVTDLSAGSSIILPFEWNTDGVAVGNYTIWAEASVAVGETNEDNNRFTMEGGFKVSVRQIIPIELIVAGGIILIVAVTAVYFIKFRKPKLA